MTGEDTYCYMKCSKTVVIVVMVMSVLRVGMEVHFRCVKNDRRRYILLYEVLQTVVIVVVVVAVLRVGMEVHIRCVKNDRRHILSRKCSVTFCFF